MLNKRQYDVLSKIRKSRISYTEKGFSLIDSNADYGRHMIDELYGFRYIESTGNHFLDKSGNAVFVISQTGAAAMVDYRHTRNKERFNRAFNFISGLVVGLITGFAVTAFSFWMMVRFAP